MRETTQTERPNRIIRGRPLWQQLTVAAAIGVLIAVIGPFDTYSQLTLPQRFGYWVPIVVLNTVQVTMIVSLLLNRWPHLEDHDPKFMYLVGTIGSFVAGIPATAEVFMLEQFFRPTVVPLTLETIVTLYFYIVVLSLMIAFPMVHFAWIQPAPKQEPPATPTPAPPPPAEPEPATPLGTFQQRLPHSLRGTLYLVRSEDHYLRVFTEKGDDLILMRLGDAVQELSADAVDGLQVHRSAWVAKAGLSGHRRENRKVILTLVGDLEQSVSKTYLTTVKEAGWLE